MLHIPHWYIPSFYGDIRLQRLGAKRCKVIAEKTTDRERLALTSLMEAGTKKGWIESASQLYSDVGATTTTFEAPINQVAAQLAKILKPNRKVVSAVRFANGLIEEIHGDAEVEAELPTATAVSTPPVAETATAAASVAAPTRGCPEPSFQSAELKARGVLATFLTSDQLEDFAKYNRFVSVGADTGHRYMVTSRQARDALYEYQRTLYDLDEARPLCVHDWSVPAAEEMLSLHMLLSLPGWERYLRSEEHDVEMAPELWSALSGIPGPLQ